MCLVEPLFKLIHKTENIKRNTRSKRVFKPLLVAWVWALTVVLMMINLVVLTITHYAILRVIFTLVTNFGYSVYKNDDVRLLSYEPWLYIDSLDDCEASLNRLSIVMSAVFWVVVLGGGK